MANFFKKTWLLWFIIIPYGLLFLAGDLRVIGYSMLYFFIYFPLLLIVALILNIKKNLSKNLLFYKDWKFWTLSIPILFFISSLIYIIIFNSTQVM